MKRTLATIAALTVLAFASSASATPPPWAHPKHTPTPSPSAQPSASPRPSTSPTVAPSAPPTPTPTTSPTPTPTPSSSAPAGFNLVFSDDFNTPFAEGAFPTAGWYAYPHSANCLTLGTWSDTSHHGCYDPSIVSAHDGLLDAFIRTSGGEHKVAAFGPAVNGQPLFQLYGRYEVRFRADSTHGYKGAWLLWPQSETWPRDGEIDWPEGDFDQTLTAFMHHQGACSDGSLPECRDDQDAFPTSAVWTAWHTAATEWTPTAVRFYLDGALIGTSTTRIPNTPMRWVIQNETTLAGFIPADNVSGHIQLDYAKVWSYGSPGPTPTPVPSSTPAPTPTPTAQPGSAVIVAVGDIHGEGSDADSVATRNATDTINPAAILGLGDYQYSTGSCSNFMTSGRYNSDWGAETFRMYPTFGPTHDYDGGAAEAARYFSGLCSGQTAKSAAANLLGGTVSWNSAYSFNVGGWHVVELPSLCYRFTCDTAAITSWLTADLNADTHTCELAFWHEPYWTSPSAEHGRTTAVRPWVQVLYDRGVDLVLNGHQHFYERFAPQNMSDQLDTARGITEIISGTGGIGHYTRTSTAPNSVAYNAATFGVLRLDLGATGWASRFVPVQGGTFADSSSGTCH